MHYHADLSYVTCGNCRGAHRVHHIIAAWSVRTSLGTHKHYGYRSFYHEGYGCSCVHHCIRTVSDYYPISTVLYLLMYGTRKLEPVGRTHVLTENTVDHAAVIVRYLLKFRDRQQNILS